MDLEMLYREDLQLSDKLAIERTIMASDRSLLATVRTSLSLIAFGFTIFKVLEHLQQIEGAQLVREHTPRNIGIFLLVTGIVPLSLATYQYQKTLKRLGSKAGIGNPNLIMGAATLLLGVALLVVTVMNLEAL